MSDLGCHIVVWSLPELDGEGMLGQLSYAGVVLAGLCLAAAWVANEIVLPFRWVIALVATSAAIVTASWHGWS